MYKYKSVINCRNLAIAGVVVLAAVGLTAMVSTGGTAIPGLVTGFSALRFAF